MTLDEFKYIVKEAYGNRDRFVGIDDFPEQIEEVVLEFFVKYITKSGIQT